MNTTWIETNDIFQNKCKTPQFIYGGSPAPEKTKNARYMKAYKASNKILATSMEVPWRSLEET